MLTAFAAFAPGLLYEFLHGSKTGPPATGQSSQVSGQVWVQFAVLGAVLIAFEFLVDGTVGVLAGRSEDGSGAGRPHAVESPPRWVESSSD